MSLFTIELPHFGSVSCPRCRRAQFVRLVRHEQGHDIYDCTKCGPVPQGKRTPQTSKREGGL